ncbi:MAG: hypothetical protein WBM41_19665 [Arenicellales bacterium]
MVDGYIAATEPLCDSLPAALYRAPAMVEPLTPSGSSRFDDHSQHILLGQRWQDDPRFVA